jgi:hypothetical protein
MMEGWTSAAGTSPAALTKKKGATTNNDIWTIMKGANTLGTRNMFDGLWSKRSFVDGFRKVQLAEDITVVTNRATFPRLTDKAADRLKKFPTGYTNGPRLTMFPDVLMVPCRSHPTLEIAVEGIKQFDETVYQLKIDEDSELMQLPPGINKWTHRVDSEVTHNQAELVKRLVRINNDTASHSCLFMTLAEYDDQNTDAATESTLRAAAIALVSKPHPDRANPDFHWSIGSAFTLLKNHHPDGAQAVTAAVMLDFQRWFDEVDVSGPGSNILQKNQNPQEENDARVARWHVQVFGVPFCEPADENADEDQEVFELEDSDGTDGGGKETAKQRRRMEEIDSAAKQRKGSMITLLREITDVKDTIPTAAKKWKADNKKSLKVLVDALSPTVSKGSKSKKKATKPAVNPFDAVREYLQAKGKSDGVYHAAAADATGRAIDTCIATLGVLETDSNAAIAMMVADGDTDTKVSDLSKNVAGVRDAVKTLKDKIHGHQVAEAGTALQGMRKFASLRDMFGTQIKDWAMRQRQQRSYSGEVVAKDIADLGAGRYTGPNPEDWSNRQLECHVEADWKHHNDILRKAHSSFFALYPEAAAQLSLDYALQVRNCSFEQPQFSDKVILGKTMEITDPGHQSFMYMCLRNIPVLSTGESRPMLRSKETPLAALANPFALGMGFASPGSMHSGGSSAGRAAARSPSISSMSPNNDTLGFGTGGGGRKRDRGDSDRNRGRDRNRQGDRESKRRGDAGAGRK